MARFTVTLFVIILLAGCGGTIPNATYTAPASSNTASSKPTITLSPSPKPSKTATLSPTASATLTETAQPTLTPTPATPTPIELPLTSIEQHCVTMQDSLTPGFLAEGSIILANFETAVSDVLIITPQDNRPRSLFDHPMYDCCGETSPDTKWLAYMGEDKVIILSSDGKIHFTHPWNSRWRSIQGWLDPERIVLDHVKKNPVSVDVFNPFTGQGQVMVPAMGDIYEYTFEDQWGAIWKLVYDPSLTRLAYMRDHGNMDSPGLVLIDLESGQTLWELKRFSTGERFMPTWSPDGTQMAAVASDDAIDDNKRFQLFTVDREGRAIQWIDVRRSLDLGGDFIWSPNSRYLAFFGDTLYILDMKTRQVFDYCVPDPPTDMYANIYPKDLIHWSPDSTQVLYQRFNAPAVVIDLKSNRAVPLVDDINIRPIGWLSTQP